MMQIEFNDVSKRYAYEWIFRKLNYRIDASGRVGIIGPNGSGKSTLLKVLLATIDPSEGNVLYSVDGKNIPVNEVYEHVSFTAPYMGIPDNMTISELLSFHFKFKQLQEGLQLEDIPAIAYLDKNKHKLIRQFSSGMKQRFKLAMTFCTKSSILVLDEPTTNLDVEGKEWFHQMVETFLRERTLIIATNEKDDLRLVQDQLNIIDYKKKS